MKTIEIPRLQPIQLVVKDVGPFEMSDPFVIAFLGPHRNIGEQRRNLAGRIQTIELRRPARPLNPAERDRSLANFCYFHELGGHGISAALDYVHFLFSLMSGTTQESDRVKPWPAVRKDTELQLDLLATSIIDGERLEIVLSIWVGAEGPRVDWKPALAEGIWQAESWVHIGFDPETLKHHEATSDLGKPMLDALRSLEGTLEAQIGPAWMLDSSKTNFGRPLPTVIRFGYGYDLCAPGYVLARSVPFDLALIENVLVGHLSTLSSARAKRFLAELSDRVFEDDESIRPRFKWIAGQYLAISDGDEPRSLYHLDEAERAVFIVHAAIMLYGTQSTIVVIDRIDRYIDEADHEYLHRSLAKLIDYRSGTSVMNVCARETTIDSFIHHAFPGGIVKGGARAAGLRRW